VIYTSDHGDNVGARGLWGKSTLYEESAGVPLIVAGRTFRPDALSTRPVSHIDCAPTILEVAGLPPRIGGRALPGASLLEVANGATPQRPVIAEYHAIGSVAGAYMLRFDQWKYCHYVGAPPQLFDLGADPDELSDVAGDPRYAATLAEGERRLRAALDPEATDARAKPAAGGAPRAIRRPREGARARRPGLHARARRRRRDRLI